jgi:hypothetical protein
MEDGPNSSPNRIHPAGHANGKPTVVGLGMDRWLWGTCGAVLTAVLGLARHLVPDARGFGTHTQLGLPGCGFLWLTGLPCPACGLTTCFAYLAHGQFASAARANPVGVLLFACVLAGVPLCAWACARKRACFETLARMRVERVCLAFAGALLLQWSLRIARLLLE